MTVWLTIDAFQTVQSSMSVTSEFSMPRPFAVCVYQEHERSILGYTFLYKDIL